MQPQLVQQDNKSSVLIVLINNNNEIRDTRWVVTTDHSTQRYNALIARSPRLDCRSAALHDLHALTAGAPGALARQIYHTTRETVTLQFSISEHTSPLKNQNSKGKQDQHNHNLLRNTLDYSTQIGVV